MQLSQHVYSGKRKYLIALLMLAVSAVIGVTFGMKDDDGFDLARREIMLRKVGHQLLLQSGDSTSRVLPVRKIAENEYQLRFEQELSFQPDSLVKTTQKLLSNDPGTRNYVVNVLNCGKTDVVFGFAIADRKKDDIIACSGRIQPPACYILNVKFKPAGLSQTTRGYLLGSLPLLALVGLLFFRSVKNQQTSANEDLQNAFSLGSLHFDVKTRQLVLNGKTLALTGTETRLLQIFASAPNETI